MYYNLWYKYNNNKYINIKCMKTQLLKNKIFNQHKFYNKMCIKNQLLFKKIKNVKNKISVCVECSMKVKYSVSKT